MDTNYYDCLQLRQKENISWDTQYIQFIKCCALYWVCVSSLARTPMRRVLVTMFAHSSGGILVHSSLPKFSKSFKFLGCHWNSRLQLLWYLFFYWVEVWRLTRPLHDLNMLLVEPLPVNKCLQCWRLFCCLESCLVVVFLLTVFTASVDVLQVNRGWTSKDTTVSSGARFMLQI